MILRFKNTFFGLLVMAYDRVGDGDEFSCDSFGLGRSPFHDTATLKLTLKNFARKH